MSSARPKSIAGHALTALADIPDYRDRWYEPTLAPLRTALARPADLLILDQGAEGACTGFGLAAVIHRLHQLQGRATVVSARMLYEMARRHDEWRGENYEGSSCRGAIKGWYHMGVCTEESWPSLGNDRHLSLARAKEARAHTLGAYYRVRKNIVDMHAALNEVGAVFVSATVHEGWEPQRVRRAKGRIAPGKKPAGGHAFAITGYDAEGFFVQNSWGPEWGDAGVALWPYEDWIESVTDAWVVQLALSTPQLYSRRKLPPSAADAHAGLGRSAPRRDEIAGHFVHIDDGRFHETGKYWSTLEDVRETAQLVAASDKYDHILFYAHGGLNSPEDSARRIAALRDTFKENRVYPYHFMYDTGLMEELRDIVLGKREQAEARVGGLADWTDRFIELATRRAGRALWREMKADARDAFSKPSSAGAAALGAFLDAFAAPGARPKHVHLVGHSTGAILHTHLLAALARAKAKLRVRSVSFLAPALHADLFEAAVVPHLGGAGGFGVDRLDIYNLTERAERDDHVGHVYRKSLLYLVSRAFEETIEPPAAILGLAEHSRRWEGHASGRLQVHYAGPGRSAQSNARAHGDFDNDAATMNAVLRTVLDGAPVRPFTREALRY